MHPFSTGRYLLLVDNALKSRPQQMQWFINENKFLVCNQRVYWKRNKNLIREENKVQNIYWTNLIGTR